MRVAFAGSSGTGKSTLAAFLAEEYGLPLNPVGSRSVSQAMGFASPYDVDAAGKRDEFQRLLVEHKTVWEAEHESFVTDRTTLDNLAYSVLHGVRSIDETLIERVVHGTKRYTHVVYCPVGVFCDLADDPARVQDLVYQHMYDAVLIGLLQKYGSGFELKELHFGDLALRKRSLRHWLGAR